MVMIKIHNEKDYQKGTNQSTNPGLIQYPMKFNFKFQLYFI